MKLTGLMMFVALLALPAGLSAARLGDMKVRVFNARTGEWDPVFQFQPDYFSGWNWPGSSEDLEVIVTVVGEPKARAADPLTVTVTSRREDKLVLTRRFAEVWLNEKGVSYQVIPIPDAHCAGRLEVIAKLGAEEKKLVLGLDCGD